MPFPIPPSYVEYATKPEVRTAVDHILSKTNPEIPSCLAWTELPAFYRAVRSAHQVRCEFDEAHAFTLGGNLAPGLERERLRRESGRTPDRRGPEVAPTVSSSEYGVG